MFLVAAWGKIQGTLVQVVLAWLLSKEDFGKIGLAYTVTTFANLIVNPGLSAVLIQRSRRLRYWATPAFWMSLTCGLLGALLMLAAAPVGARLYDVPELVGLVTILAIAAPIGSLNVLPNALLNSQLRFKLVALLTLGVGILNGALTVLFAALDFGSYSFVLPIPIVNVVQMAVVWSLTRPRIRMRLHLDRWKFLIGNARWMFVYLVCSTAIAQGDYIVLGLLFDPTIVGVYFFGFTLAMQGARFIGGNLQTVLYPSLVALGSNSGRQAQIVLEASKHLGLAVPLACALQAILAEPILHVVFDHRWDAAIPVAQLLSVGVAFESISLPGAVLLQVRGRFRAFALIYIVACAVFFAFVYLGASLGEEIGVAASVACYYVVVWVPTYCLIMRSAGIPLRDTLRMYLSVILSAGLAGGAGLTLSSLLPSGDVADWQRIFLLLFVTPVVFYTMMWKLEREACLAARNRLRQLGFQRRSRLSVQGGSPS